MFKKTVTLEIEIPITFEYIPGEPGCFHNQGYAPEVEDLDWNDEDLKKQMIEAITDPGLHDELIEYAEAEIKKSETDNKILAAGY